MPIKLLVADDHQVVRAGLKSMLTGTDIKIVGEAATGEAALRLALKHNPDVVLMDIRMPDGDGLTGLNRIKLARPTMPVLIWSAFDNPTYVARAVALGTNGYVLKSVSREKLLQANPVIPAGFFLRWYNAPMIDFFIELAMFFAIAIVVGLLKLSFEAAELLAAFFAIFLALCLGFRSALRDARRRHRRHSA